MKSLFHYSAIKDDGAEIGRNTSNWHWNHISSGSKIGFNCYLGQNIFLGNKVLIVNNVKIQNKVSIYDDGIIEENVFIGPSMVFTNLIKSRSEISRKSEYKKILIEK